MRAKINDPDQPLGTAKALPPKDVAQEDQSGRTSDPKVISTKLFRSPKGNIYRITKTNEVDDYAPPIKPTKT